MTDLHTHILPFVDDGAKSMQESLALLLCQKKQGIHNVALTSHFDCETTSIDAFLEQRAATYTKMMTHFCPDVHNMHLKLGSEVRYSPRLQNIDCDQLCLEGTKVLLLELPTDYYPTFGDQILYSFYADGFIPLIAHVERYPYAVQNPSVLHKWISNGAYIQVNANALLRSNQKKWVLKMIRWGLVHVICSDAHSMAFRPPNISEALNTVAKEMGNKEVQRLKQNATDLFNGIAPEHTAIHKPRNFGGVWF